MSLLSRLSSTVSRNRRSLMLFILVAGLISTWALAMPRSVGPDEPGHLVRSGALVRGDLDGRDLFTEGSSKGFELPSHIGFPDPGCFAFDERTPSTCVNKLVQADGEIMLGTKAASYPIWGHLAAGLGTFAPPELSTFAARMLDAAIPALLITLGLLLLARLGPSPVAAGLLALTPSVWFILGVVNPSGLVIAGAFALWSAASNGLTRPDLWWRWGTALGFAAVVLPRRDGLIWAALIVALAALVFQLGLRDWWRALRTGPQITVGVSAGVALMWSATSDEASSRMLLLAPLIPLVAVGARRAWIRHAVTPQRRLVMGATGVVVAGVGALVAMSLRTDGFDGTVLTRIVGRTGTDLSEALGILGWLDTPVPLTARAAWLVAFGMLVGIIAVLGSRRDVLASLLVLAVAVGASWVLTMLKNDDSGSYWQGRYYLPLLVGVPIVAAHRLRMAPRDRDVVAVIAAVALAVPFIGFAAALRRFGVGTDGSWFPWRWGGTDALLSVLPALAAAAFFVGALWQWWWLLPGPFEASARAEEQSAAD